MEILSGNTADVIYKLLMIPLLLLKEFSLFVFWEIIGEKIRRRKCRLHIFTLKSKRY